MPLVKAQAASREQLDQARAQRDSTSANLAAAQAEEKIAAARVQSARALLASHNEAGAAAVAVTAPIAGVITKRQHQSRTPIAAGELLMEMGDPAQLEIEADILSADAVRLAPGTRARIRHWGGDDLDASVRRIEPGGFTKTSALGVEEQRTRVILDLTSPHAQWQTLGDAYRVDIEFILAEKNGALTIPLSALYRDGDGWAVYRINDARARHTAVQTGLRTATDVEITAGLANGDRVILQPDESIHDGSRVQTPPE